MKKIAQIKIIYAIAAVLILGSVIVFAYQKIRNISAAQSDALNFYCKADEDFVATVFSSWQKAVAEFTSGLGSGGGPGGPEGPTPAPNPGALAWPVSNPEVGQPFCEYCNGGWHGGIDLNFSRPETDHIYAAADGTVTAAGYMCSDPYNHLGNYVTISHTIDGKSYTTDYFHLSSISVSAGQHVDQGDSIGNIGKTCTDWVHLHFALRQGGIYTNPCRFLPSEPVPGIQCLEVEGCRMTPVTCSGP